MKVMKSGDRHAGFCIGYWTFRKKKKFKQLLINDEKKIVCCSMRTPVAAGYRK